MERVIVQNPLNLPSTPIDNDNQKKVFDVRMEAIGAPALVRNEIILESTGDQFVDVAPLFKYSQVCAILSLTLKSKAAAALGMRQSTFR